ncbi:MAG TPA: IS66 family transposase [Prolixibacteraceae bacterium]|nr:IS66 family transposase [Prolixibacteraceae bacterium]HCU64102.1 IS66 family transposase [Prolixibacteraceae bacterium]
MGQALENNLYNGSQVGFGQLLETNRELLSRNAVLESLNSFLESQKSELESRNAEMEGRLNQMQFQIDQMSRLLYGAKRERYIGERDEKQMVLPFDVEPVADPEKQQETISYVRSKTKREDHPGRMALPSHLPVEEIIIEPGEDTTGMKCIGREVTDQLELVPAKLYIKRYIRPKYIKQGDDGLTCHGIIAPLPVFPIEKGIAGPGLLAQIMIDKFVDHLPVYRQIERFKREQVRLSATTINGWQEAVCNLLAPLYETLKHRVLSQGYLQVDETPIQVLDKEKKGKTHRGYHWVYYSPIEKTVLFDYRDGRSREGPSILLKDFIGYLQTDGYKVYDPFGDRKSITLLNCMAHARRGFEKALEYDRPRAEYAMGMFQKLYDIERRARQENMTPAERYALRLDQSLPLLNELGKWMVETWKNVLPKSPVGKATAYCIPRWDNLMNYLHDGSLEIDNNFAENAIRPIALGRKNYLFAGSARGAERAAMFYSFFGTCQKNNVNPYHWLKKVLEVIPEYKVSKLHELLPQNLKL